MGRLENLLGAWSLTVADRITEAGRQEGLSASAQAALLTVLAHPDRPVSWLGEVLMLTGSGATRLVDRLVAAGWVVRSPGADSRQRRLRLTAQGEVVARRLALARDAVLGESLRSLDERTRRQLERILERMVGSSTHEPIPALRTCRMCDRSACRSEGRACPLDHVQVEEALP